MGRSLGDEARSWIADCEWGDLDGEDDVRSLSDDEAIAGVERHYEGGVAQFKANSLWGEEE